VKKTAQKQVKNIASAIRQSMLVASIALITASTTFVGFLEYRVESKRLENRIAEVQQTALPLLANALWSFNDDTLKIIGDQILASDDILAVTVWDEEGRLRYDNLKTLDQSDPMIKTFIIHSQNEKKPIVGRLRFEYTEAPLFRSLRQTMLSFLLFNILKIIALNYFLISLLNRLVIRPLNKLGKTILLLPEDPRMEEPDTPRSLIAARSNKENEIASVTRFIAHREQRLQQLIADLQSRELTLRESESHQRDLAERLQFLMQANQLGSWEINTEDGEAIYNDRWSEILGILPAKVSPTLSFWNERIHPSDQDQFQVEWSALVKKDVTSIKNIHRIRHESGAWIWVLCTGTAVYHDASDKSPRIVGTNLDISDLVNAREEALAATKSKSEFLANMSHEIRTPLNGVLGMTSLLKRTKLDATQLEFIKTIDISGKQLLSVISDILDLSKVEAGKFELSPVATNIRTVVENVVRILGPAASTKGLTMTSEISDKVPESVYCDDTRLQQVLVNLTSNATKFTAFGGVRIVVDARPSERYPERVEVEFHVIDNGIGIPPDALKNMFKAFSQADATVNRKYGGTGLGLAISKQIVGLMSGEISVSSVINSGSDFKFTILVPTTASVDLPHNIEENLAFRNLNVLIAEDNLISQKVLFKMIRTQGILSSLASNGVEAVHQAVSTQYHLIFMDLVMPEMDGLEATRRILAHVKAKGLPTPTIIAVTATATPESTASLKAIGFADVLEKPITLNQLKKTILLAMANSDNAIPSAKEAS
jgi:signal transduction histidine kinase/CheY-like chemotaxis protein